MPADDLELFLIRLYHDPRLRDRFLRSVRAKNWPRARGLARAAGVTLTTDEARAFEKTDRKRLRLWVLREMRMFCVKEKINPALSASLFLAAIQGRRNLDDLVEDYFASRFARRYDWEPLERFAAFLHARRPRGARQGAVMEEVLAHDLLRAIGSGALPRRRLRGAFVRKLLRNGRRPRFDVDGFLRSLRRRRDFQDMLFEFDGWRLFETPPAASGAGPLSRRN